MTAPPVTPRTIRVGELLAAYRRARIVIDDESRRDRWATGAWVLAELYRVLDGDPVLQAVITTPAFVAWVDVHHHEQARLEQDDFVTLRDAGFAAGEASQRASRLRDVAAHRWLPGRAGLRPRTLRRFTGDVVDLTRSELLDPTTDEIELIDRALEVAAWVVVVAIFTIAPRRDWSGAIDPGAIAAALLLLGTAFRSGPPAINRGW
jgi:hypothetical protein